MLPVCKCELEHRYALLAMNDDDKWTIVATQQAARVSKLLILPIHEARYTQFTDSM